MKKSLLTTTGSFALVGVLAGLAAFGGTALAANMPTPTTPSTAIVQSSAPAPAATQATSFTAITSQEKASGVEAQKSELDKDNINYEEQGDNQDNNGIVEKNSAADTEKDSTTEA